MDIEPLTDLSLFIIVDHNKLHSWMHPGKLMYLCGHLTKRYYISTFDMHFFLLLIIVKLLNIQCTYFSSFTLECRALQALQLGEKKCANVNLSPAFLWFDFLHVALHVLLPPLCVNILIPRVNITVIFVGLQHVLELIFELCYSWTKLLYFSVLRQNLRYAYIEKAS